MSEPQQPQVLLASSASCMFGRLIAHWGRQCAHGTRRDSLAFAGYYKGILRVEGMALHAQHLLSLRDLLLLQSNGNEGSCIWRLEILRCELGGSPLDLPPTPAAAAETEEATRSARAGIVQALLGVLGCVPKLQILDLSNNQLNNQALAQIVASLAGHRHLREVVLEDNRLTGEQGGTLIRSLLDRHATLTCLNISENALGARGAVELATGLARHGKLVKLNLACCEIHPQNNQDKQRSIYQVLVDGFLQNPQLQELQWSVGEVDETDNDTTTTTTRMDETLDSGTLAVARLLEHHPRLQSLSIIQSPDFLCPDQPMSANLRLVQALGDNRTVERLALEGCGICDDTVALLCNKVLLRNPTLQHLDLLSNDLQEQGHDHLHQVLPKLKYLRSLFLEGSTLDKPQDFVAAMEKNTSLTNVRISDTPDMDISATVDRFAQRNYLMIKTQEMLDETSQVKDAIWAKALARLAPEPEGLTAMYRVISHKRWLPATSSGSNNNGASSVTEPPPPRRRKRPRLA